jgi:hypothetical protein
VISSIRATIIAYTALMPSGKPLLLFPAECAHAGGRSRP